MGVKVSYRAQQAGAPDALSFRMEVLGSLPNQGPKWHQWLSIRAGFGKVLNLPCQVGTGR